MYLVGMICRRKLKKIILLIFFAFMIIKIHKDYQELNKVNDKDLETMFTMSNDSSHITLIRLNNIKDIIYSEKFFNKSQRNFPIKIKEGETSQQIGSRPLLPTKVETTKTDSSNMGKEDKQVDNKVDNISLYDNRIHYNPSFKKKMEEAVLQKQEHPKNTSNHLNNRDTEKIKNATSTEMKKDKIEPIPSTNNEQSIENVNSVKETNNKTHSSKGPTTQRTSTTAAPKKINKIIARIHELKVPRPIAKPRTKEAPFKVSHVVDSTEISFNQSEISRIRNETYLLNERQQIYNEEGYGPLTSNDTVIVVQVHNRLENLRYLVESLTLVKDINTSLVIFSHDFWDDNINNFVRSISAFKVMQIYFPNSIQLNPYAFPGRDPRDCLWNQRDLNSQLPKQNQRNCLNSNWPDSFGHYREASFTQIKHHWWWKLIHIYENIRGLQEFSGQVMFLEEDHYVVPDILHVLKLLIQERDKNYHSNSIFGLGNYQRQIAGNAHLAERGEWIVNKYNLGFAFNRSIYNIIKDCQNDFCNYDDYNWDWSLAYIVKTCALNKLLMLSAKFSRVLHIGSCGTHYRKGNCVLSKEVIVAKERIKNSASKLFPRSLSVLKAFKSFAKPKKSNGGWGDYRDKKLCLAFMNETYVNNVLQGLQFPNITKDKSAS